MGKRENFSRVKDPDANGVEIPDLQQFLLVQTQCGVTIEIDASSAHQAKGGVRVEDTQSQFDRVVKQIVIIVQDHDDFFL